MKKERSAIIVGAGVCGLSCAWWLTQENWKVTVIEKRDNKNSGPGYLIGLWGPGFEVAKRMGLIPKLKALNVNIGNFSNLYINGKKPVQLKFTTSDNEVTVWRNDLISTLLETSKSVFDFMCPNTVKKIIDNDNKVKVVLKDHSILQSDLLIGADGIHSMTRRMVFGDSDRFIEHIGERIAVFSISKISGIQFGDNRSYQYSSCSLAIFVIDEEHTLMVFIWKDPYGAKNVDVIQKVFRNCHADVIRVIKLLPKSQLIFTDSLAITKIQPWHRGRVIIMGDAAHAVSPFTGQGAGMAMTSAFLLTKALKNHRVPLAFEKYEQALRPVINRLQTNVLKQRKWLFFLTRILALCSLKVPKSLRRRHLINETLDDITSRIY